MALRNTLGHAQFTIKYDCAEFRTVLLSGYNRWALETLIAAGGKGCIPLELPAPRWSAYIHNLRRVGVPIATFAEPCSHSEKRKRCRYVLAASVEPVQ